MRGKIMNKRAKFEIIVGYALALLTVAFIFMLLVYEYKTAQDYTATLSGWESLYALGFALVYIIFYIPTALLLLVLFILTLCFTGGLRGRAKLQKIVSAGGELPQGVKYKAPSLVGLIVVKIIAVVAMLIGTIFVLTTDHVTAISYVFYPMATLLTLASAVVSCINHKKVKI